MNSPLRKVTYKTVLGYGVLDIFGGGAFAVIGIWLLFFYTTYCGLSPLEAGSILAIARILDAVLSPVMGYITDKFGSTWAGKKFGRRRFFLMIGAPLMLTYTLIWIPEMGYWYYLSCYLLIEVIAAMVLIPWETLATEMTSKFSDRTRLSGMRMVWSQLGNFLAVLLPGVIISHLGKDSALTYTYTGFIFSLIFMVAVMVTYFSTWESQSTKSLPVPNVADLAPKPKKLSPLTLLKNFVLELTSTFKIRIFRQHIAIYICSFTSLDIFGSVFIYFMVFGMNQDAKLASYYLTVCALSAIPSTLLFTALLDKFSVKPSTALIIAYSCILTFLGTLLGFYLHGEIAPLPIMLIMFCLFGFGRAGLYYIPWNVYTFIADVDEIITRERREGIFAGVMTLTRKSTVAIAMIVIGLVMQLSGFVSGAQQQSPQAVDAIVILMIGGTALLLVISIYIASHFTLTKHTHAVLIKEVARLKLGGKKEDASAEACAVIKSLTGYDYQDIWEGSAPSPELQNKFSH